MQNNNLIAQRIKLLRISHNLSIGQLADIFNKTRAAFSQIESGKRNFSQEALIEYADFFAVSLDWITGRSDEPYSLPVIERLENEIIDLERNISLNNNTNLIYLKAVMYCCLTTSSYYPYRKAYSLARRAEIIYCLHFWKYASIRLDELGYNSQEVSYQEALAELLKIDNRQDKNDIFTKLKNYLIQIPIDKFIDTKPSKQAGASFASICYECIKVLDMAIQNHNNPNPYFDLNKSPSE